jgi:hypothetical protein
MCAYKRISLHGRNAGAAAPELVDWREQVVKKEPSCRDVSRDPAVLVNLPIIEVKENDLQEACGSGLLSRCTNPVVLRGAALSSSLVDEKGHCKWSDSYFARHVDDQVCCSVKSMEDQRLKAMSMSAFLKRYRDQRLYMRDDAAGNVNGVCHITEECDTLKSDLQVLRAGSRIASAVLTFCY